jgi:hypothetical protein
MPLRREYCPQVALIQENPNEYLLTLEPARSVTGQGHPNLLIVALGEQLELLKQQAQSHQPVALVSVDGGLHANFYGQVACPPARQPNLIAALQTARLAFETGPSRPHRRILLILDEPPADPLQVEALALLMARDDTAVDVLTSIRHEKAWEAVTGQAFGLLLTQDSPLIPQYHHYLETFNRFVFRGAEITVQPALFDNGSFWRAWRLACGPLRAGEIHSLRIHVPPNVPSPAAFNVRFPGEGYSVQLHVPGLPAHFAGSGLL